jgi:hypothetical protein
MENQEIEKYNPCDTHKQYFIFERIFNNNTNIFYYDKSQLLLYDPVLIDFMYLIDHYQIIKDFYIREISYDEYKKNVPICQDCYKQNELPRTIVKPILLKYILEKIKTHNTILPFFKKSDDKVVDLELIENIDYNFTLRVIYTKGGVEQIKDIAHYPNSAFNVYSILCSKCNKELIDTIDIDIYVKHTYRRLREIFSGYPTCKM